MAVVFLLYYDGKFALLKPRFFQWNVKDYVEKVVIHQLHFIS